MKNKNIILADRMGDDWYELLSDYLESEEFTKLGQYLNNRRKSFNAKVFPEKQNIFRAFKLCPLDKLKVVIIGMDPYPTEGNANGLAFAYKGNGNIPKSLQNIHKELENDAYKGLNLTFDYTLESWAKQGILLINTALTVEEGKPGSHSNLWKNFTKNLFEKLAETKAGIVYVCWGNHAKRFIPIFKEYNLVIQSVHPSPLSAHRGFFGSKPFSKVNTCLKEIAISLNEDVANYLIKW